MYLFLSTSLFIYKKDIHQLVKNCISPFLDLIKVDGFIDEQHYILEFESALPRHLKFSILCKNRNAKDLAEFQKEYFQSYFNEQEVALDNMQNLTVDGIFLAIPFNSIQFGLYSPLFINSKSELENYHFQMLFSKIQTEMFKEKQVNDDEILIIAFQIFLTMIFIITKKYVLNYDYIITKFFKKNQPEKILHDLFRRKFEVNFKMLKELSDNIFNSKIAHLPWLKAWTELCEEEFGLFSIENEYITRFEDIKNLIYKHLPISHNTILLNEYFILNYLMKYNYPSY